MIRRQAFVIIEIPVHTVNVRNFEVFKGRAGVVLLDSEDVVRQKFVRHDADEVQVHRSGFRNNVPDLLITHEFDVIVDAVRGHQREFHPGVLFGKNLNQLQAAHAGHTNVGDDQVDGLILADADGFETVRRRVRAKFARQIIFDAVTNRLDVVHDEDRVIFGTDVLRVGHGIRGHNFPGRDCRGSEI